MNFGRIFVYCVSVCYFIPQSIAGTSAAVTKNYPSVALVPRRLQGSQQRIDPAWVQKICKDGTSALLSRKKFFKRESSMSDSSGDGDDSEDSSSDPGSSSDDSSMMTTLKGLLKRIPQINFYSTIPNAVGVVGQGFSVLEKISIALGTPLPYYIGSLPIVLFGIALVFIPDLTTLSLFGFYPNGAGENDPLAAFPPAPDLDGLPDVDLSLSPDNIPPRIIPPSSSSSIRDQSNQLLQPPQPLQSTQEEEEADSPTNPESFQSPRRKIGERQTLARGHYAMSQQQQLLHYQQPVPQQQQHTHLKINGKF